MANHYAPPAAYAPPPGVANHYAAPAAYAPPPGFADHYAEAPLYSAPSTAAPAESGSDAALPRSPDELLRSILELQEELPRNKHP